ncbi:MAG: DUF1501 domain-containing protein [Pseudomonadales bacterium]|nr:DUF1501 domain-containing protein [Pseudomonadales bacterium]
MYRRQFLKYLGSSGLSLAMPFSLSNAQSAAPDRFWISVNAGGGWDPIYFIDPKGDRPRLDGRGPVNNYSVSAITSSGNIVFPSSYPTQIDPPDANSTGHFANFFPKHANRLLVINGVDTQTNNHDAGSRYVWSGKIEDGYPSFGAIAAAASAPTEPLAYISNGGYDNTASLVAPARIGEGEVFQQLAFPNASRPWEEQGEQSPYFDDSIYAEIEKARLDRLNRLVNASTLPLQKQQMNELLMSRVGDNNLNRLVQLLPERVSSGLEGQAEVAVAAFSSGIAVSANMHMGGFDTHGNHDQNHSRRLTELLEGIDHLWTQIEQNDLQDRVTVIVGSDFGRTPFYNDGNGKDHWNVISIMAMGAGVRGNRVIGGTNDHVEALSINPQSLQLDPNGVTLTPEHIHVALRRMAGIDSNLNSQFGIAESYINLFG